VTEAAQGDMFERRASELALDKATSADVRAFAQMMLVDHDRTTDDLQEAIQRADIDAALPTKLDAKHQALLSALESKQGSAFDDSYAEIQQKAHRDALELHEGYRDTGTVEALRVVAIGAVPVIQRHLTLADRLP
jgi:putative membrane protein